MDWLYLTVVVHCDTASMNHENETKSKCKRHQVENLVSLVNGTVHSFFWIFHLNLLNHHKQKHLININVIEMFGQWICFCFYVCIAQTIFVTYRNGNVVKMILVSAKFWFCCKMCVFLWKCDQFDEQLTKRRKNKMLNEVTTSACTEASPAI